MMRLDLNVLLKKSIWLLTVVLISCFIILEENEYIGVILLTISSIIFILDCIDNGFKIRIKIGLYQLWGFLFALFCVLSAFWAKDFYMAFSKGLTVIQIIICMTVIYNYYCKKDNYKYLLTSIEYAGYFSAAYTVFYFGINDIKNILFSASRIDNSFANANSIGIACAISMVMYVYYALYERNRNIIKLLFAGLSVIVMTVSASRTAMIGFVFGSLCLFLFRFASRSVIKTALKWSAICAVFVGLLSIVVSLEFFDSLNQRMVGLIALMTGTGTIDHSAWLRQQFMKIGIEQFLETPLFGIGIDNARFLLMQHFGYTTYLHNNYVELLASGGIIGTSLFYSIYVYIFVKLKKNWYKNASELIAVLAILSTMLITDFGAVSYYSKIKYFYLLTGYTIVKVVSCYKEE